MNPASAPPSELIFSRISCRAAFAAQANQRPALSASKLANHSAGPNDVKIGGSGTRAVIRTTGTFGNEVRGGANLLAMFCWFLGRMRCLSPHEHVSTGGLGQREITRLGLWYPNTSLRSAFSLGGSTMAADDQRGMEALDSGLWMTDAILWCWLAAVVELMSL